MAGLPRLDGETAGFNSCQRPSLKIQVLSVSEENVVVEVVPPKIYRLFKIECSWNSYIFFYKFKAGFIQCFVGCGVKGIWFAIQTF